MTINTTANRTDVDVIVVGGSYSGLAAGMALGRALRHVLIVDSGQPCNVQTPYSHNFLTQDGRPPREIWSDAKRQVQMYDTVQFVEGTVVSASRSEGGFVLSLGAGDSFSARKIVFATGIKDSIPDIEGFAECWGISVLHCPYCHGYEVRAAKTGVLGNGAAVFDFIGLLKNWTADLTLFTNGPSLLTQDQLRKLESHRIQVVETKIARIEHTAGVLQNVVFEDGEQQRLEALYSRLPFEQSCSSPELLGCELTEQGYIKVDLGQKTTVSGVYASGDNASSMRTLANAVATGTTAGITINRELSLEEF